MQNYYVEVQFKKGKTFCPTFSITKVPAMNKEEAKSRVIIEARANGFCNEVKKVIIKEI